MQLFSIGLVELNADGTRAQQRRHGRSRPTARPTSPAWRKVFTGWSWSCPAWPDNGCFFNGQSVNGESDPDRASSRCSAIRSTTRTEEKSFLGITIPAQSRADPAASLKVALDALASHPNVGPFIGRQLIQRLVTSNPSPAYVARVAAAFANNGAGVRGDMKAVVKAVLLHPEARAAVSDTTGKVREPVLRLSAYPARLRPSLRQRQASASATPTTLATRSARRRCARRRSSTSTGPATCRPARGGRRRPGGAGDADRARDHRRGLRQLHARQPGLRCRRLERQHDNRRDLQAD